MSSQQHIVIIGGGFGGLACAIGRALSGRGSRTGFRFHNRGNTAVIRRNAAVFDFGSWTLKGRAAWLLWALVHVYLLINFEKRILVAIQWIGRYLTRQRGARIIDEQAERTQAIGREDQMRRICHPVASWGPNVS
jgi:NADH dehydrogenase FAD-containing subunit